MLGVLFFFSALGEIDADTACCTQVHVCNDSLHSSRSLCNNTHACTESLHGAHLHCTNTSTGCQTLCCLPSSGTNDTGCINCIADFGKYSINASEASYTKTSRGWHNAWSRCVNITTPAMPDSHSFMLTCTGNETEGINQNSSSPSIIHHLKCLVCCIENWTLFNRVKNCSNSEESAVNCLCRCSSPVSNANLSIISPGLQSISNTSKNNKDTGSKTGSPSVRNMDVNVTIADSRAVNNTGVSVNRTESTSNYLEIHKSTGGGENNSLEYLSDRAHVENLKYKNMQENKLLNYWEKNLTSRTTFNLDGDVNLHHNASSNRESNSLTNATVPNTYLRTHNTSWNQSICALNDTTYENHVSCFRGGLTVVNNTEEDDGEQYNTGSTNTTYNQTDKESGWREWSQWSKCSPSCGMGVRVRTRTCANPPSGKEVCWGGNKHFGICNISCVVQGNWGNWSSWSQCFWENGDFRQIRTRGCSQPYPLLDDKNCIGNATDDKKCDLKDITFLGTSWTKWTTCSVSCGQGFRRRSKRCVSFNLTGNHCSENDSETILCSNKPCGLSAQGNASDLLNNSLSHTPSISDLTTGNWTSRSFWRRYFWDGGKYEQRRNTAPANTDNNTTWYQQQRGNQCESLWNAVVGNGTFTSTKSPCLTSEGENQQKREINCSLLSLENLRCQGSTIEEITCFGYDLNFKWNISSPCANLTEFFKKYGNRSCVCLPNSGNISETISSTQNMSTLAELYRKQFNDSRPEFNIYFCPGYHRDNRTKQNNDSRCTRVLNETHADTRRQHQGREVRRLSNHTDVSYQLTRWSDWSGCSVSSDGGSRSGTCDGGSRSVRCDGGSRSRNRLCVSSFDGNIRKSKCSGNSTENIKCMGKSCLIKLRNSNSTYSPDNRQVLLTNQSVTGTPCNIIRTIDTRSISKNNSHQYLSTAVSSPNVNQLASWTDNTSNSLISFSPNSGLNSSRFHKLRNRTLSGNLKCSKNITVKFTLVHKRSFHNMTISSSQTSQRNVTRKMERPSRPHPGPVNKGWLPWRSNGSCNFTCVTEGRAATRNKSSQSRVRPREPHGARNSSEIIPCFKRCLFESYWTSWTSWSICPKNCKGYGYRTRTCKQKGVPQEGVGCVGTALHSRTCRRPFCTIEIPTWSTWTAWSNCTQLCGVGSLTRSRSCNSKGVECDGDRKQTRRCNTHPCHGTSTKEQHHLVHFKRVTIPIVLATAVFLIFLVTVLVLCRRYVCLNCNLGYMSYNVVKPQKKDRIKDRPTLLSLNFLPTGSNACLHKEYLDETEIHITETCRATNLDGEAYI